MKLQELLSSLPLNLDLGVLILRITVGLTMSFYGYQKLSHYSEMVTSDFWQNKVNLFGFTGAAPLSLTIFAEFC